MDDKYVTRGQKNVNTDTSNGCFYVHHKCNLGVIKLEMKVFRKKYIIQYVGLYATLFPKFAVEDLSLGRTATFVLEIAVEDLSLSRKLDDIYIHIKFNGMCIIRY